LSVKALLYRWNNFKYHQYSHRVTAAAKNLSLFTCAIHMEDHVEDPGARLLVARTFALGLVLACLHACWLVEPADYSVTHRRACVELLRMHFAAAPANRSSGSARRSRFDATNVEYEPKPAVGVVRGTI
jgi:hypothetical protein